MAPKFVKDTNLKDDIYEIQKELKDLDKRNTKLYQYLSKRLDKLDNLVEECLNLQNLIIKQDSSSVDKPGVKQLIFYTILYTLVCMFLSILITDSEQSKKYSEALISYFTG